MFTTMTLNINLQEMPQLVLEKITSFLNHKQLLALEQVSKKLKCAVDGHFTITDHLIIGSLPATGQREGVLVSTKDKKCFDCFNKMIERCGPRLRTIQINVTDQFSTKFLEKYYRYFRHLFGIGGKCSNIEKIITSPKMIIDEMEEQHFIINEQNVLLPHETTFIYANQLYDSTGQTCKLRSICLNVNEEQKFERILRLFPNLEQIAFNEENLKNFLKFLPKFIENGLKDLKLCHVVTDFQDAKKLCDIGKNLRILDFTPNPEHDDNAIMKNLHPPSNVKFRMMITKPRTLLLLDKSIGESITTCYLYGGPYKESDCSSLLKMKNVEEIHTHAMQLLKTVTQGSFPKLAKINIDMFLCSCKGNSVICESTTFLTQLLANKGNQLTVIKLDNFCSLDLILKALKHCKAAILVDIRRATGKLTATNEEMMAIFNLPNLQKLSISHYTSVSSSFDRTHDLIQTAAKEATHFKFYCKPKLSDLSCDTPTIQKYLWRRIKIYC